MACGTDIQVLRAGRGAMMMIVIFLGGAIRQAA
jgi:hypothetical protein